MGGQGPVRRGEVHREHYVAPGKGAGDEVQPQPLDGDGLQGGASLAVEHSRNLRGKGKHSPVDCHGDPQHGNHRVPKGGGEPVPVPNAIAAAENGLNALGNSRINRDNHQGEVGDDPVGRHACVALHPQNQRVKDDDHNARGNLRYQGGHPAGKNADGPLPLGAAGHRLKLVFLLDKMGGENANADQRRQSCGEYRPEDSHAAGEDEHPVQYHVGKAAPQHGRHGELRRSVVAHKTQQHVVHQERRGK